MGRSILPVGDGGRRERRASIYRLAVGCETGGRLEGHFGTLSAAQLVLYLAVIRSSER